MRKLAFALVFLTACEAGAPARLPMPGRLVQALSAVEAVEAEARLVPRGGDAGASAALTRGDDGVSFSGFVPAEPGEYTLEVTFTGVPASGGARLFLGRWTSDAFTVAEGDTASPNFSRPIDPLGGPEDGGDLDGDGLANLDELLLGSLPRVADSDEDGLVDGRDCRPTMTEVTPFEILAGGSALDCDADGARRPDAPYGPAGMDCDDTDPAVSPAATDDCATPRDEDCNPATCPSSDVDPPSLVAWTPAEGETLGCHARLSMTLEDEGGVAFAQVVLPGVDGGLDATLYTTADGDTFTSRPLNEVAGSEGLVEGAVTARLEAQDLAGNRLVESRGYTLQFAAPQVSAMTPTTVGAASAPVQVEVQASAALGLDAIELYRVAKAAQGYFDVSRAALVGTANASPARFTVDPAALEDGEHLLFPVARDAVGNEARPGLAVVPTGGAAGLEVDADFRCVPTARPDKIPVRVLVVGSSGGYQPATMRQLLPQALDAAQVADPGTELVQAIGFGVGADGTVGLDDAGSYTKRWMFGFRHPSTGHNVSVTWLTPAYPGPNPTVDPDAGNVVPEDPITDVAGLVDSPAVVAAVQAMGQCPAMTGTDNDQILYIQQAGEPRVLVTAGGETWVGQATGGVAEVTDCQ